MPSRDGIRARRLSDLAANSDVVIEELTGGPIVVLTDDGERAVGVLSRDARRGDRMPWESRPEDDLPGGGFSKIRRGHPRSLRNVRIPLVRCIVSATVLSVVAAITVPESARQPVELAIFVGALLLAYVDQFGWNGSATIAEGRRGRQALGRRPLPAGQS